MLCAYDRTRVKEVRATRKKKNRHYLDLEEMIKKYIYFRNLT